MPKPSSNSRNAPSPSPARGSRWTGLLLVAAAAVTAGTIYIAVRPPWERPAPPPARPGPSPAEQTRRAVLDLIARADAVDSKGGPVALVAKRQGYETARNLAARYVQLSDPRDVLVRPALARAQLRLGQLDQAEKTIDGLLRLSPRSAEGLWMKGELLVARGDEGSAEFFRKAAESDDATPVIWTRYGRRMLIRGRLDEARTYLTRAYQAGQRDPQTLQDLARVAMRDNQFARAEELLAELLRTQPAHPRLLGMLAEAQSRAGRLAEAETSLRRALDLLPEPRIWLKLGEVLQGMKRLAEAAEAYAKGARSPEVQAVAALKAARCYYVLDKHALARKYIELAASHGESGEVAQLRKAIESAGLNAAGSSTWPAFRLLPAGSMPDPPKSAEPAGRTGLSPLTTTRPAGLPR